MVIKLTQVCEQNAELLFMPVSFTKGNDSMRESSQDSQGGNESVGNWVKRVLKLQKVLHMIELKDSAKRSFSQTTDSLCRMMKETLMSKYPGLLTPKGSARIPSLINS